MTQASVSLIGSFRQHYSEICQVARIFTAAGMTVKSPPISRIIDPEQAYVRFETDPPKATDLEIQAETLKKIFSSDFVYVVNAGGYIGQMTAYELGRVAERGMAIYYAEPPKGILLDVPEGIVLGAGELVAGLAKSQVLPRPFRRPRVAAGLGSGLTSESAGAARAVLISTCRPGPRFSGTCRRCRSDLPGLGKRPGFTGPGGQRVRAIPQPQERDDSPVRAAAFGAGRWPAARMQSTAGVLSATLTAPRNPIRPTTHAVHGQ